MLEIPHILHLHGNDKFTSGDVSFSSDFQLFLYPAKTILLTSTIELGLFSVGLDESGLWVLTGDLSDDRPIFCDNLFATSRNSTWNIDSGSRTDFRFTPFRTIEIGEKLDQPIKEAFTPLVGFYEGQFTLHDDGWEISSQQGNMDTKSLKSRFVTALPMTACCLRKNT